MILLLLHGFKEINSFSYWFIRVGVWLNFFYLVAPIIHLFTSFYLSLACIFKLLIIIGITVVLQNYWRKPELMIWMMKLHSFWSFLSYFMTVYGPGTSSMRWIYKIRSLCRLYRSMLWSPCKFRLFSISFSVCLF